MNSLLSSLSPLVLLLLIGIIIVLLIVVVLIVLWRTRRKQDAMAEQAQPQPEPPAEADAAHQPETTLEKSPAPAIVAKVRSGSSVASAVRFLRENSTGLGRGYGTPWFLVLGASASGKSALLEQSGISLSLRQGATNFGVSHGIRWHFFDAGVILDVPGEFFIRAGQTGSDERSFKALLNNLVKYRPRRPLDGVVLTIPSTELFGPNAVSPAVLEQRAARIFDKLWMIQKWTGLSFPVYVLVTQCDLLPGFFSLAEQLPARYRREMFGWSNPYNLEAAFDQGWIDQGFDELAGTLNRLQSEVFVEQRPARDLDDIFLFAGHLHDLRRPLRTYLGHIFKRSSYRESLRFRGFYFTGYGPTETIEVIEPHNASIPAVSAWSLGTGSGELPSRGDALGLAVHSAAAPSAAPIFVADLFEHKVFPERGLARPVSTVRLSRNRSVLVTQAACLLAVLVLGAGLWIRYGKLLRAQYEFVPMLESVYKEVSTVESPQQGAPVAPQIQSTEQATRQAARQRLQQQLSEVLQTRDTAKGLVVDLPDVLFGTGQSTLKPEAKAPLAKVSGIIVVYPDVKLTVNGYTDSSGPNDLNQALSERRAASVRDFLAAQGVAPGSMAVHGLGKDDPIASNDTPGGRQLNRRVELVLSGASIGQGADVPSTATQRGFSAPGEDTANALVRTVEFTSGNFRTVFYPDSLVAPVETRLQRVMVPVFEDLVFKSFRRQLLDRGRGLVLPGACAQLPPGALGYLDSYQRLCAFTARLLELEANITTYNVVSKPHSGDVHQLAQLQSYLSGARMDEDVQAHTHIFDMALDLSNGVPINPKDVDQVDAINAMESFTQSLFREWFSQSAILRQLDTIRERMDGLDKPETAAALSQLVDSLKKVQADVAAPEYAWVGQDSFQLTPTLSSVTQDAVSKSNYFLLPHDSLYEFVNQVGNREFSSFVAARNKERTRLLGDILKIDKGSVQLADNTDKLRAFLEDLLHQPFAQHDAVDQIQKAGIRQQLIWNRDLLQEAATLQGQYQRFIKPELANAPPELQDLFQMIAAERLDSGILELVAQAETVGTLSPSDDLDLSIGSELASFQDAAPLLDTLLNQMQQSGQRSAYQDLLRLTVSQASRLLETLDASYEAHLPYETSTRDFSAWTGDNMAWVGFGVHNADEVSQYLQFQRQQAQLYAGKATPLINFLQTHGSAGSKDSGRPASKWRGIADDIQKLNSKTPGTALAGLEDFIGVDLDKLTPDNCQVPFLTTAALGSNYFTQRHEALRRPLYNRCRLLSEQNAVRHYLSIARLFNSDLAGKFPFGPPTQEQLPREADPADIEKIYSMLDSYEKSIRGGLQKGEFLDSYGQVLHFLNELDALRPLFSSWLAALPDSLPAYDFIPIFRVNQDREINANQIIDWNLQVGTETFHYHDAERTGHWNFGDPVKVVFRWAKDSPQKPNSGRVENDAQVARSVVSFEYRDSWSLLRMILLHRPPPGDFNRLVDPDPQTLVFTVDTTTGNDSVPETKVYVRIRLRLPGKMDNLRLRDFPTAAPDLGDVDIRRAGLGGDAQ